MSRTRLFLVSTLLIAVVPLARSTAGAHDQITVLVTDLVANLPSLADRYGIVRTPNLVDRNLVNPWGIAESSTSPFWLADKQRGSVDALQRAGRWSDHHRPQNLQHAESH